MSCQRQTVIRPYRSASAKIWYRSSSQLGLGLGRRSSISATVDLSEAYAFKATGMYSATMRAELQYFAKSAANSTLQLVSSNAASFSLEGGSSQPKLTIAETLRRDSTSPSLQTTSKVGAARTYCGLYFTMRSGKEHWQLLKQCCILAR